VGGGRPASRPAVVVPSCCPFRVTALTRAATTSIQLEAPGVRPEKRTVVVLQNAPSLSSHSPTVSRQQ